MPNSELFHSSTHKTRLSDYNQTKVSIQRSTEINSIKHPDILVRPLKRFIKGDEYRFIPLSCMSSNEFEEEKHPQDAKFDQILRQLGDPLKALRYFDIINQSYVYCYHCKRLGHTYIECH